MAERIKLPYLFLDSGGLLFKQSSILTGRERQEEITAEGIAEAMQAMNCRAVGIEAHDLAGGLELLKKIQTEQKLTWLSMNLIETKTKKTIFAPSLLTEIAGLKVAVIGLTDEQVLAGAAADRAAYSLLPWHEVLPKTLEQVKGQAQAEMIILLSSAPYEINKKIAETYPSVSVILSAGPTAAAVYPFMINETLFAQTGAKGKTFGMMRISWTAAGKWEQNEISSKIRLEQTRIDQIKLQLNRLRQQSGEKDLAKSKDYQKLLAEEQQAERNINAFALQRKKKTENENLCRFNNDFITLESSLPEDPKVREIIARTTQRVNDLNKEGAEVEGEAAPLQTVAGSQRCGTCHVKQAAFWQKTGHAACLQNLIKKNQQFNDECLLCHVTLPYYDQAKVMAEKLLKQLPERLKNVGCESCHGPAAAHAGNPAAVPVPMPKPAEQICKNCHTPEQDAHFVFADKVQRIRCPQR